VLVVLVMAVTLFWAGSSVHRAICAIGAAYVRAIGQAMDE
jgi:hypothetical protein